MNTMPVATSAHSGGLEKVLGIFSIVTMAATVPQVVQVWSSHGPTGVSLITWIAYLIAACLWLVHGVRKRDRSIYLACIGWIALDAAIVIGVLVRQSAFH